MPVCRACLLPGKSPLSSILGNVRCGLEVYLPRQRTWLLQLLLVFGCGWYLMAAHPRAFVRPAAVRPYLATW
jgi:hypothetical protein